MHNPDEEAAVRACLQHFFDGIDKLDAAEVQQAFYPQSHSVAMTDEGIRSIAFGDWDSAMESVNANPKHPFAERKSTKTIRSIDIAGSAAAVKVEWLFSEFKFTCYYNMLKVDDRWYIMNNVYSTAPV